MTAAALICTACGAELREDNKFCHQSGARHCVALACRVQASRRDCCRRVQSMNIATDLDMERLREVMTELVERLATVARRYGGTVESRATG